MYTYKPSLLKLFVKNNLILKNGLRQSRSFGVKNAAPFRGKLHIQVSDSLE